MTDPVISNLRPHVWNSEQSVAYEAAIEAINGVVAAYSALIAEAENPPVSQELITEYRTLRTECQQVRKALRAEDTENVARVRAAYAAKLRELTETGA
ncbi:hypothetical protein [Streptomyces durocortorensis]|uniref:Uncharacterized protein n=1 Tax=Streptomyces durocortorensis TaxID=2811104 RepID=A0ABS2HTN4_9ACTN|nr:hypothetical protein [Streptomyces durocortorensis]MBM7054406.1 hypothetical protein [Streptomyces durocortorensis]